MDYSGSTELWHTQWQLIRDPENMLFAWAQDEREGEYTQTPIDKQHTLLFDHIFDNNHIGTMNYLNSIDKAIASGNNDAINLSYTEDEAKKWNATEKTWIDQWKIRVMNSDDVFRDVIKSIKDAEKDEKISKIVLRPKHIYIGKYKFEDVEYPVAIYGNGENTVMTNAFTKIQVTDSKELEDKEKKKYIYCDETILNYLVIAFYEDGKTVPSMIMQIEKFDISKMQNTKDKWLEFLGVLDEKNDEDTEVAVKIDADLLSEVYPDVDKETLIKVAEVINKYSNDFKINTPERMSHLLGQLGTETNFKASEENCKYSESRIKEFWGRMLRNCSDCKSVKKTKFPKLFIGYDENSIIEVPDSLVLKDDNDNYTYLIVDEDASETFYSNYNTKSNYTNNCSILNYVYANILDNGNESTENGSRYRGRGYIQITGKSNYSNLTTKWNEKYKDDKKDFENSESDRLLMVTDSEVGMKISLLFWDENSLNDYADKGMNDTDIENVTKKVNGGITHLEKRQVATKAFYNKLK